MHGASAAIAVHAWSICCGIEAGRCCQRRADVTGIAAATLAAGAVVTPAQMASAPHRLRVRAGPLRCNVLSRAPCSHCEPRRRRSSRGGVDTGCRGREAAGLDEDSGALHSDAQLLTVKGADGGRPVH